MTQQRLRTINVQPIPQIDPDGLLEYSVVFTDRSSITCLQRSTGDARYSITLKDVFQAEGVAIVPGGGTFRHGSDRTAVCRPALFGHS